MPKEVKTNNDGKRSEKLSDSGKSRSTNESDQGRVTTTSSTTPAPPKDKRD